MDLRALRLRMATHERIPSDFLKAVHAVLLAELRAECVLEFWARHPLSLFKGALPPAAFFRYLWESEGKVPPAYFWSVMEDLESYLESQGLRADRFFQLLNHGPGGGPALDPGWLLGSVPPPEGGGPPDDPRGWLLEGIPSLIERLFPGSRMERIGAAADARGDAAGLFLFQPIAGTRGYAAPDFRLFPGKLLLALPRLLGCSAFDRLEVLADMRGPAACLAGTIDATWHWKGETLHHGRKRMGHLETLAETVKGWPAAGELRDGLGRYLRCPVLSMERDFATPSSREARLRAGCAYGAPVFLVRIGYAASRRWSRWAASLRKSPPPPQPRRAWEMVETLHREMLAALAAGAPPG